VNLVLSILGLRYSVAAKYSSLDVRGLIPVEWSESSMTISSTTRRLLDVCGSLRHGKLDHLVDCVRRFLV